MANRLAFSAWYEVELMLAFVDMFAQIISKYTFYGQ
jgi:hypothetical protein